MTRNLKVETARVFKPLLAPARYKAAHGGRGSGKSWFFADSAVDDCIRNPGTRMVCIREVQKDLKDSAYLILKDRLAFHGLGEAQGFKLYQDQIATPGDGLIIFKGMRDYTAESIKSLEGFSRAWVEEAQTLSQASLNMLTPTIFRRPGAEIWFSWNPRRKGDAVDALFRGAEKPTGAVVVRANWSDNPWFPEGLDQERRDCLRIKPDQYEHIWEGGYASVLQGAYFAASLAEARIKKRIGRVERDPLMEIKAFWDIGVRDATAIWIAQWIGRTLIVLDYYEAVGQPLATHLQWLRDRGYKKAHCYLPHDGSKADAVTATRFEDHIKDAEFEVTTIPNQGKGAALKRVETARRLFPSIWFNEATCGPGLDALGWYHEKRDEDRGIGLGPEHDWCLALGTQILTASGWRPVETILVGDRVVTPCGLHRVLRSGVVRMTDQWATVRGIRCTPEHRFFTSRGLVEAGELSSGDEFWTRGDLGLRILAFLCAILSFGLKTAITLATPEGTSGVLRYSFTGWCMRLFMAKFRRATKSTTLTTIRSTITQTISKLFPSLSIAAATSHRFDFSAFAECARRNSAATSSSAAVAAPNASGSTMREPSESAEPAYNLTVAVDECYFVRGSDGLAYLVSNSSHGADAFGLMCVAYEEPIEAKKGNRPNLGQHGWLA